MRVPVEGESPSLASVHRGRIVSPAAWVEGFTR